jgi:hypothetical protein
MKKCLIILLAIVLCLAVTGCSPVSTQAQPKSQAPTQSLSASTQTQTAASTQSAAQTQAPASTTAAQVSLKASDAAKAAADADDSGAPYFVAYEYDATNYLVSAYQNQQDPGNYSGGGAIYLVNKTTGKVVANNEADVSSVDFSKYLAVYNKLSGKIE